MASVVYAGAGLMCCAQRCATAYENGSFSGLTKSSAHIRCHTTNRAVDAANPEATALQWKVFISAVLFDEYAFLCMCAQHPIFYHHVVSNKSTASEDRQWLCTLHASRRGG